MKLKIKFHLCGTQSSKHDMQNIVTWGQKTHLLLVIFTCISMGGLFSGVPPYNAVRPKTRSFYKIRAKQEQKLVKLGLLEMESQVNIPNFIIVEFHDRDFNIHGNRGSQSCKKYQKITFLGNFQFLNVIFVINGFMHHDSNADFPSLLSRFDAKQADYQDL